jgi:phosphate transport system permease protein
MSRFGLDNFSLLLPFNILSFVFLIIYQPTILLFPIIVILEMLSLFLLYKRNKHFLTFWQLQFFVTISSWILLYPSLVFNFGIVPFSVEVISIVVLAVLEILVLLSIFFGERLVKPALLSLSLTTVAIVVLILLMVCSEGFMGLQENNPVKMMTSTAWQPQPEASASDKINLTIQYTSDPFDITTSDLDVHTPLNFQTNIYVYVVNNLEKNQSVNLDIDNLSRSIMATLPVGPVNLTSRATNVSSISISVIEIGQYIMNVTGRSSDGYSKTISIHITCSQIASDISSTVHQIDADNRNASGQRLHLTIVNRGIGVTTILKIQKMDSFYPFIVEGSLDPDTQELVLHLEANSSTNITIFPNYIADTNIHKTINITLLDNEIRNIIDIFEFEYVYNSVRIINGYGDTYRYHIGDIVEIPLNIKVPNNRNTLITVISGSLDYAGSVSTPFNNTSQGNSQVVLFSGNSSFIPFVVQISPINNSVGSVNLTIQVVVEGDVLLPGIEGFVVGTFITVILALVIAVPFALGAAIFLSHYCSRIVRKPIRILVELLAGIPSVIYGLWGLYSLGPFLLANVYPLIDQSIGRIIPFFHIQNSAFASGSIMTASIVLAIMILPIMLALSEDALSSVPRETKEASLGLGASRWDTIRRISLPSARSGIFSSVVLAMGRAIGETMAVLMIMGAASSIPTTVFSSGGTMTSVIAANFGAVYADISSRRVMFAIAMILFIIVLIINLILMRYQNERSVSDTSFGIKIRTRLSVYAEKIQSVTGRVWKSKYPSKTKNLILKDKVAFTFLMILTAGIIIILIYVILYILVMGGSNLQLEFFTQPELDGGKSGGFLNAILGSISLVAIAMVVAIPLGVGTALYLNEYEKAKSTYVRIVSLTISTLSSTPSIVFGIFGFMLFVVILGFKFSLLAGGLTLGIMAIPIVMVSSVESLKAVPMDLRHASYALGVSKWSTIRGVVIPSSLSSIASGVILAIGRVIGETAAVLLTAGYASYISTSVLGSTASLPNMIYNYYNVAMRTPEIGQKVFGAAAVLIIIILILNLTSMLIAYLGNRKIGEQ